MQRIKNLFEKLDILLIATTGYLLLPILIFLLSWTKIYYSIIFIGLFIWFIVSKKKQFITEKKKKLTKDDVRKIILVMVIIFIWLLFSGCGGIVSQTRRLPKA